MMTIAMTVKEVHQGTNKDQQVRKRSVQVRLVLRDQKESCHGEKTDQDPL